jgi:TPR repeat protein
MSKTLKISSIFLALLICSASVSYSQDFDKGISAHSRGDYAEALREWQPLVEQGRPDAQYALGEMYKNGQGVKQDHTLAFELISKSANQGIVVAKYALGEMYLNGQGVEYNPKTAFNWISQAAGQGLPRAQTHIGVIYKLGLGVQKDLSHAKKWWLLSAQNQHPGAFIFLGKMYDDGEGVLKDNIKAHMWWNLAGSLGESTGTRLRKSLESQMTKEDISKAQGMARRCLNQNYKGC